MGEELRYWGSTGILRILPDLPHITWPFLISANLTQLNLIYLTLSIVIGLAWSHLTSSYFIWPCTSGNRKMASSSSPRLMCRIDRPYSPPPHLVLPALYVGRAIYTECWETIPQYTVSLSLCLVTHWLSPHHHHLHLLLHLPSFLTLRKSQLNFLFAVTIPVFRLDLLDF